MPGCLFCKNPTWTWYEFMRENCGKENYGINEACSVHQEQFRQQLTTILNDRRTD